MRAAIYARYSTDRQSESSIDDQLRACREYAGRHDLVISATFADEGVSGAAIGNRPGFRAMMAAAEHVEFDILLLADLSRLSRSAGDLNKTIDRLTFRGIRVIGVQNGYDSSRKGHKLQAGVEGVMGESFREMIRDRTHEALRGRMGRGLSAGGQPYGYRSVPADGGHRLEIDEAQAEVIRWIFTRYAEGQAPRRIAHELNARSIASPRGGTWAISALYGQKKYGTGILRNELYRGVRTWNRSRWEKDPDTGRRKRRERETGEIMRREFPELAIIMPELWAAVRSRLGNRRNNHPGRPARTLLGGILRCGHCGGPVTAIDARLYGCAIARDRGKTVCEGVAVKRQVIEGKVLEILREDLLSEAAIEAMRREVAAMQANGRKESEDATRAYRAKREALSREIRHLTDAVAQAGWSEALRERLWAAETELAELAAPQVQPPEIITRLIDRYAELVRTLPEQLKRDPEATRIALREVLGDIRLVEDEAGLWAEIQHFQHQIIGIAGAGFGRMKRYRVA